MARVQKPRTTTRRLADAHRPRRGRPRTHQETWSRINIVLFDRQIWFLDHLSLSIRRKTGSVVNRTQIVRALVDALKNSRISMSSVHSEADLVRVLTGMFRTRGRQG